MDGIFQREVLQFLHLCGIVEEDDAVAHKDTHQRHETEDGGQRYRHASEEDTHSRTEDAQRQTYHDEHGLADLAEVPQQHEEDDGNRDDQGTDNFRRGLVVIFILTANLHLHVFGQLESL